jgi:hypothetical protein
MNVIEYDILLMVVVVVVVVALVLLSGTLFFFYFSCSIHGVNFFAVTWTIFLCVCVRACVRAYGVC